MACVVVTGGTGLLGSEIVDQLVSVGNDVVCLGRSRPQRREVEWIDIDLSRPFDVGRLPSQADAVVYLAQSENFRDFPRGGREVFAINVAAPSYLLDWSAGAKVSSFVLASSGGVYGGGTELPLDEDTAVRLDGPLAHYISSKRAAELLSEPYSAQFSVASLRYFFIYGPQQKETMLMRRLVGNVKARRPLTLQGENGMMFNPVHVSDAAEATIAATRKNLSGIFNIAGPDLTSIREVGELAGALTGAPPVFVQGEGKPNHLVANIDKMKNSLAIPKMGIRKGIMDLCNFA